LLARAAFFGYNRGKEEQMYEVHTEITLKNGGDVIKAKEGLIKKTEVRQETVQAAVDTGAWTLVINEETRIKLGLEPLGTDTVSLAGGLGRGASSPCVVVGPLEVWWKDRRATCDALVLPHANEILLGAIPLEGMDIMVDARCQAPNWG
jgi:predicted aspartyl protease